MQLRRSQHLATDTMARRQRRLKVLLVEPDLLDVRLFQESFRSLKIAHDLQVVSSNAKAMTILKPKDSVGGLPDLILLGMSALKPDGLKLLGAIRASATLRTIPVIVLASSSNDADVYRAYELGVNSFLTKPADDFVDLIGDLDRFWFRRAELPVRSR